MVKSYVFTAALSFILILTLYITYLTDRMPVHSGMRTPRFSIGHLDPPQNELAKFRIKINDNVETFLYQRYQPIEGGNSAEILAEGCHKPKIQSDGNKIELITGFVDYNNPIYGKTLGDLRHITDDPENVIFEARHMEVINVLQINLLHDMVGMIHVLVLSHNTAAYLKSLNLKNSKRLVIRVIGKDVGIKDQLEYASECLDGRVVAITNQDNTIGRGWENKEYIHILKEKNIMYGLTRHSTATESPYHGSNCTWTHSPYNNCDDGGVYMGSHDTFIFHVRKWKDIQLRELPDITPDMPRMETFFLWFFNKKMNYTILNPCKCIFVHHHHCVTIRGLNRHKVNFPEKHFSAEFTDKLQ